MACDATAHDQLLDPICCLALLRELAVGMVGDMAVVQVDGQLHPMNVLVVHFSTGLWFAGVRALPLAACLTYPGIVI